MNQPKLEKILYPLLMTTILCLVSCSRAPQADRIFTNGHIITINKNIPKAETFAIKNEFILDVGTNEEMREAYPLAPENDLDGKDIMPGIIESHGHMLNLGRSEMRIDLRGVNDPQEIVQKIKEQVSEKAPCEWIQGWG